MDKNILIKLLNNSTYEIARQLNVSQTNVRYWLKKHNLKNNFSRSHVSIENGKKYKICPKCSIKKEFTKDNYYIKNGGDFHSWCRDCNNKISHNKQKELKIKAVEYMGGKCFVCNYNKCISALEFHHIDPDQKEFSVSQLRTYSWEKVKNELNKCICLCSNCHREVHAGLICLNENGGPYRT